MTADWIRRVLRRRVVTIRFHTWPPVPDQKLVLHRRGGDWTSTRDVVLAPGVSTTVYGFSVCARNGRVLYTVAAEP